MYRIIQRIDHFPVNDRNSHPPQGFNPESAFQFGQIPGGRDEVPVLRFEDPSFKINGIWTDHQYAIASGSNTREDGRVILAQGADEDNL